ncbi:MAG: hypothetical protein U9P50_02630 [Patescibacteria group bacterium]|nr:hypothetical protein [Patescibacteria group bacterium]
MGDMRLPWEPGGGDSVQNAIDHFNPGTSGGSSSSSGGSSSVSGSGSSGGSSGGSSSGSSSSSSSDAQKDAERAARNAIEGQYDAVRGGLEGLLGGLSGQQEASRNRLNDQSAFSRGQVGSSLQDAMGRFQGYQGDIMSGQKSTLRDLSGDVRNAFQAGNIYLGARGASNSSAAGMYSRGIQQSANRNRADVKNQTETNLSNLNIRREEANSAADRQYAEIDNWLNGAVADLESQFNARRQEIEMAMSQADADEQQALANLNMQLISQAQNAYQSLQSTAGDYVNNVSKSLEGISGAGGQFADQMTGASAQGYNKQTSQGIDGNIGVTERQSIDPYAVNPNKRDEEEFMNRMAGGTAGGY